MNIFRRWSSGVVASFDWVASQVENHEALVAGAIREMEEAAAKARVQLQRVQRDGQQLRDQLETARSDSLRWKKRAKSCEDNEQALECVRRKRRSEREAQDLKQRLDSHVKIEKQLRQDLEAVTKRVVELRQKKNSFLARKYTSDAHRAGSMEHVGLMNEIDDIFARWGARLAECEPLVEQSDSFAEDFEEREELAELEAELQHIRKADEDE